jgi:hypothetical protein
MQQVRLPAVTTLRRLLRAVTGVAERKRWNGGTRNISVAYSASSARARDRARLVRLRAIDEGAAIAGWVSPGSNVPRTKNVCS